MEESVVKAFSLSLTLFAGYLFTCLSPYRRFQAENLRADRYAYHVLGVSLALYLVGVAIAVGIGFDVEGGPLYNVAHSVAQYTHIQAPVMIAIALALIWMQRKPEEDERPVNLSDPLAIEYVDLKCKDGALVEVDMQDMGVVILWSEVQSLTLYDDNIYRAFQDAGPAKKTGTPAMFGKDGLVTRLLARFLSG